MLSRVEESKRRMKFFVCIVAAVILVLHPVAAKTLLKTFGDVHSAAQSTMLAAQSVTRSVTSTAQEKIGSAQMSQLDAGRQMAVDKIKAAAETGSEIAKNKLAQAEEISKALVTFSKAAVQDPSSEAMAMLAEEGFVPTGADSPCAFSSTVVRCIVGNVVLGVDRSDPLSLNIILTVPKGETKTFPVDLEKPVKFPIVAGPAVVSPTSGESLAELGLYLIFRATRGDAGVVNVQVSVTACAHLKLFSSLFGKKLQGVIKNKVENMVGDGRKLDCLPEESVLRLVDGKVVVDSTLSALTSRAGLSENSMSDLLLSKLDSQKQFSFDKVSNMVESGVKKMAQASKYFGGVGSLTKAVENLGRKDEL